MPLTLADLQARGFDAEAYIEATRTFIAEPTWANYLTMQNLQPSRWEEDDDCPDHDDDEVNYSLVDEDLADLGWREAPHSAVMAALEDRRLRMLAEPRPVHDPHATPPIPAGLTMPPPITPEAFRVPPVAPTDVLRGPTVTSPIIDEVVTPPAPPEPTPIDYGPVLAAAAEAMSNIGENDPQWVVTFGPHKGLRVPFGWAWAMLFYGGDVVLNVDGMDYRALHPHSMVAIGSEHAPLDSLDMIYRQGLTDSARQTVPPLPLPPEDEDEGDGEEEEEEDEEREWDHEYRVSIDFSVRTTDEYGDDISSQDMWSAFMDVINNMSRYDLSDQAESIDVVPVD